MSGYATHLLIGAVGGLALTRLLPDGAPDLPLPPDAQDSLIVLTSAVAASWPDIDEPGSFVGQRVRWSVTILTGLLLALVGVALAPSLPLPPDRLAEAVPLIGIAGGVALGMGLVGPLLGTLVLRLVRLVAGGHRRLTHSLVLSLPLALLAALLWSIQPIWALVVGLLAWGQWLHLVGDLVTPAGVPLLYPLSDRAVCLLPRPLAVLGEPLITLAALLCGALLLA